MGLQKYKQQSYSRYIQMKAAVTIKSARGLPKLGLSMPPSAYVILKVGSHHETTGICPSSCHPTWNHFAEVATQDEIEKVTFYVYNSNSNHIDELLGVGHIEFEELMTRVITTSQVMLRNATGTYLTSWIQIQHCNANPPPNSSPPLSERSTLKLHLMSISAQNKHSRSWLDSFASRHVIVVYGTQRRYISEASPTDTLAYDSSQSQIQVELELNSENVLKGAILFQNLSENCSVRVKLYQDNYAVELIISISLIQFGVLAEKYNTLIIQANTINFEFLSNPLKQWTLMVYSIFGSVAIRSTNQPVSIYIENQSNLHFQFYEQLVPESSQPVNEPFCSCSVPVNSINWSTTLNCRQPLKMYNSSRGAVVNISLNLTVVKNANDSGLLPQFANPKMEAGQKKGVYKILQIKMFGACFNEIFTDKTKFYFIYLPNFGDQKVVFPFFEIKNSIEYTISCRQDVYEDGLGGHLCLLTYDHFLGKQQSSDNNLENYMIFKLPCQSLSDLTQSQPIYHQNFLAFAKKQSLVKPCKKLQVMIRDKALKVKISGKIFPWFEGGDLTLINCRVDGGRNQVCFGMSFDFNQLQFEGEWGDYLLQKPYTVHVEQSGVQFNIKSQGINLSSHYKFEELFLQPSRNQKYMVTICFTQQIKVTLFYTFASSKPIVSEQSAPISQLQRFMTSTPLNMKIKSAFLSTQGNNSFSLRVSKDGTVYETLEQNSCTNTIQFKDYEIMRFGKEALADYLFFNLYCKNAENGLVIYAGNISAKDIIGRGDYQISLQELGNEDKKGVCLVQFAVLNDTPLNHPFIKISPRIVNASTPQILKPTLKYYLVCELNHNPSAIFELTRSGDTLTTNSSFTAKSEDEIIMRLYASFKQVSKEGFWLSSTEKELIAVYNLNWADLSLKGTFEMRYMPTKDLCMKLSANKLAVIQNTAKIIVSYECSPEQQPQIVPLNRKPLSSIEIDVLYRAAAKVTILQVLPLSSHEKTIELQLLPFSLELHSQSRSSPNKSYVVELDNMSMAMEVIRTSKGNEKYVKNIKQVKVDLKGRRIKTQQKVGFSVLFESVCIVRANIVVVSTKFTNNFKGILQLIDFGSDNMQIKQVEIYPLESERQLRSTLSVIAPIKPPITNPKNISLNLPIATSTITFSLYFVVVLQDGQKIKSLISLVDIPIDKLDDKPFRYEWLNDNKDKGNGTFYINAKYEGYNNQAFQAQTAVYHIQKINGQVEDQVISVSSKQKSLILNKAVQISLIRPDRKRGYRIMVRLPTQIQASSVSVVLQDDTLIPLRRAQFNLNAFILSSEKNIKVKTLKIEWPDLEQIEELEQKNFTRRFLINRSPKLIISLLQQPYAIAECKPQSMTVSFMFHFFNSKDTQSKIMWTKSNKNDQILTKHLGLLIKHGSQTAIIRPINERGQFQLRLQKLSSQNEANFGFSPQIDEIEIYLFISHILNEQSHPSDLLNDEFGNWTKLFPVAYGKISLEKVLKDSLVGCEMRKIENYNETLDKSLNDIIVMPNLNCLGSISYSHRKWGYIRVELLEVLGLSFENSSENDLLFLEIEVENGKRVRQTGIKTEARSFANKQKIVFLSSQFDWFYLEQVGESENLKVTAYLLKFNSLLKIFEKRSNLFEVLREPGTHEFLVQVKPDEAKGMKSLTQLRFRIWNLPQWPKEPDVIEEARKVNMVDVVSFEDMKQSDMVCGMLMCESSSHLREVLREVKQSVIYLKSAQVQVLRACCSYLQFQNDEKIISQVLQILSLSLFKHPQIVSKLNQKQTRLAYHYLKILFSATSLAPQVQKKISSVEYNDFIKKTSQSDLDACIRQQKKRMYSAYEISQPCSASQEAKIISIMETFSSQSPVFRQLFKKDIKAWQQMVQLKLDDTFQKFVSLLEKIYDAKDERMPDELIEDVLRLGLKKNSPVQPLVMLWTQLGAQKMNAYSKQMVDKIVSKFEAGKDSQSANQSFRIFVNYLQLRKLQLEPALWKTVASKCESLLQENNDLFTLNMYGEIVLKLDSLGKIAEEDKLRVIDVLKKRYASGNDKNVKMCLGNFIDKLCGKKRATEQEAVAAKTKFYKKYLVTS